MRVLQILIKRRSFVLGYLLKYSRFAWRRLRYAVRKMLRVDSYKRTTFFLARQLHISRAELGCYVQDHSVCSLFPSQIEERLDYLRANKSFMDELRETADKALQHKLLVLNRFVDHCFDTKSLHYNWHTDWATGKKFTLTHYTKARSRNRIAGVDIKNLWELSRLQYLFAPALLYRLTNEERYAQFVRDTLMDWIACNRWEEGPNWQPSMETGIRSANMMLAFQLIRNSTAADEEFCRQIAACAFLHQRFILQNQENIGGRTSNHYLGAQIGIACIATTFPFLPGEKNIRHEVATAFSREILKQLLPDGSGFEGSTMYQQLIGEMFCFARIALCHDGATLPASFDDRLAQAATFSAAMRKTNGTWEQIGDNDGGHVFRLLPTKDPDAALFVSLTNLLLTQEPGLVDFPPEAVLFGGIPKAKSDLLINQPVLRLFPDAHIAVFHNESLHLTLSAIDVRAFDMGGHTHNDKLSITLTCFGTDFFVDPGSGSYTGEPTIRNTLRSTASHSTIQVNNLEQNANQQNGSLFAFDYHTQVQDMRTEGLSDEMKLIGSIRYHDNTHDYIHCRNITIEPSQYSLTIDDDITMETESGSAICRFVLHPEVEAVCLDKTVQLCRDNIKLILESTHPVMLTDGLYSPNYGQWQKTKIIEIPFSWEGKQARLSCRLHS